MCKAAWLDLKRHGLAFGLSIAVMLFGLVAACAAAPGDASTVAAVFPPWWPARQMFEAAGAAGTVVQVGGWRTVLIVRSNQPNLANRLRAKGALFTLSPVRFAGCSGSLERS